MSDILSYQVSDTIPLTRRHVPSLACPTDDARETLAAGRVMDMCRDDAALSKRVLWLRDSDSEGGARSWRDVLAVLLEC